TNDQELSAKGAAIYQSIAADPKKNVVALQWAAFDAERRQNTAAAVSLYRQVLAMDSGAIAAKNNLAMLIARQGGDLAEAERLATDAVNAAPRHAGVRDTLAFVQGKSRRFALAAQTEQVAIDLEPDNLTWRVRRAQFLLDSG